ncbi:probable Ribose-phosphate pyrophosphokinase 5 [Saccharomycodes ludwigii]|uniref:ribose-phosphate diphosphokinase n=1 Tax=Saccharomycodes ludwigii TaxID=36035 RepID=A0A376B7T8_9ASCO|nr:hypothetical protein SCDLUD_002559 [Saccharomycodes ludwigii]KAH3901084.1 hypothetical protein SCDLUD_002559 [Saccharomycodes ludwigii]SSD60681.1 probable Ribose-phosphate pyrophosphokinase 5 [Saccharomycodes ludwigii]
MSDIVVFAGGSHPKLVEKICENLSIKPSQVKLGKFSNGETSIQIDETVREKDVYVIQSGCGHVNDNFIQLLILINACKTASANRVTAVMPYFCYSRQPDIPYTAKGAPLISKPVENYKFDNQPDAPIPASIITTHAPSSVATSSAEFNQTRPALIKYNSSRIPVVNENGNNSKYPTSSETHFNLSNAGYKLWVSQNGTLIADLLTTAGADHVITMDLHDPQFQGFFDIPVDNLYCKPLIQNYILHEIPNYLDCVIVSPDAGGAKRAAKIADALELSFAMIHKERRCQLTKGPPRASLSSNSADPVPSSTHVNNSNNKYVATTMLVGDVRDKVCVLVDDLVDTSYTITRAAKLLKDQGATKVIAIMTHGIFSGDALSRIKQSGIDKIVVTNTVPQELSLKFLGSDRMEVLDVSKVLGEAIRRIHNGESISMLFERGW